MVPYRGDTVDLSDDIRVRDDATLTASKVDGEGLPYQNQVETAWT